MFPDLTSPLVWKQFGINTAKVVAIAFAFELLVLLLNYQFNRWLAPALAADTKRNPSWRMQRRERLRRTARSVIRAVVYLAGLLVVLEVFKAPTSSWTTPLYVVLVVAAVVGASACRGLLGDAAAGYAILLDDLLAPGDQVDLDGTAGTVESVGWRTTRIRLASGHRRTLGNRCLRALTVTSPPQPANRDAEGAAK